MKVPNELDIDGSINMNQQSIVNLAYPIEIYDAVNKYYVDSSFGLKTDIDASLSVKADLTYVDGSLSIRDTNLDASFGLYETKANLDTSFGLYDTKLEVDSSFALYDTKANLDTSLNDIWDNISPTKTPQTLSDEASIYWDITQGYNAKVTLEGDRTLYISNVEDGDSGTLIVKQDGTGSRTLAFDHTDVSTLFIDASAITLTSAANSIDILSFLYDDSTFYWNAGYNYQQL